MISRAHITAWRAVAPWSTDAQVEQDLILSRALVQIFSEATLRNQLAFRGETGSASFSNKFSSKITKGP